MNQHWYHCHTCKMVDGVGVCTVCARVCHKGHDVSYAKFGNFFCDCGAKPDSSCQALVKRSVTLGGAARGGAEESAPAPSLRRRPSSPSPPALLAPPRRPLLAANIQGCRGFLSSYSGWGACMERVRRLLEALSAPVRAACERNAPTGAHGRAQRALAQLHLGEKRFTHTDSLMLPTLGSQEGAFENVRMSYTGENGQTIRQLMSAHKLRRVAMCCLASPHGRRQHLAVSHEKGKITVLQLSALLKQADSSKHKLTLTRLSSAPIPFTVLSLSGNPWNEDLLAVCGLKECHVLTFNSGGAVADHLVLNTALEGNNYVIKALWLPGSQILLALVTSDFVKIFDLSKDLNNPTHHFLVPSGKVRDVTFVYQDGVVHMLCMSSAGHIYWQPMTEESSAALGTFYVTNTLEVLHPEIQDVAGLVGGGGVSIYYSHTLKMLFFSYAQGKSFLAPLNNVEESVKGTAMITLSAAATQKEGGGRGGGKQGGVQSLCQWAEVPGHPGLVTAVMQASNNPVVLMLTPTNIFVQEIKTVTKSSANGTPQFPIDFFEHCVAMTDIEFGGNDLLQVYNTAQIKHRLNTAGLYVVSTKMSGFSMEVINSDPNMVICGIRVLLGSQDVARTPSFIEVYGRSIQTVVVRNRWFDIPLTREESLQCDKKLLLNFGPSQDPDGVTMVDSIKVYGKNKEQFGWPEENEDPSACPSSSKVVQEAEGASGAWKPSPLERLACAALEALELGAGAAASTGAAAGAEGGAEAARKLLCAPAPPHLHARAQCLLRAVHHSHYHQYKDQAILKYVCSSLRELRDTPDPHNIDPEAYFRLMLLARGVAVARPHHLVKFSVPTPQKPANSDWSVLWKSVTEEDKKKEPHLCVLLTSVLWRLTACRSSTGGPGGGGGPPAVLSYGLRHAEHTLHALADVIHAFQLHADNECIEFGNQIYLSLLLAEDQNISFGTKAALMRVLRPRVKKRRVFIPSPPNTPGLEALLDIPPDADDETMVELAIALSLQEQPRRAPPAPSAPPPPAPGFSDATASPPGSDDEGSTAATDGSTLRTSPAEPPGSAGSESGGSGADSIGGVSGRSSAYGIFNKQMVVILLGHALDVFDNYPQLLMEMALRLPCQIHKHCDPAHFDARWRTLLCEYMMNQQTPLRKQVRKLLLLLCGTRERYRQLRDVHALDTHLNAARALLATDPAYDKLVQLMDHLKACAEIVSARTGNWQHTCLTERREALPWLVSVARRVHPHVAPTVLQLLQAALCAPAHQRTENKQSPEWTERERSSENDSFVSDGSKFQEQKVAPLVQQILKQVSQDELRIFVKAFLLETNSTAVRWQAHALLLAIYNNCTQSEQASLVSLLWAIWPTLPQYGRKAAQFVDLLGYFTLKTPDIDTEKYVGSAVELLRNQNQLLSSHGNAALYAALGAYVELDGYYLESEPCLVCNNPEVPLATIKLPTIKIDSKFTTTTQIVKLVNSHMISRISLRIGDIKRSKMVRTINFYYNNRTVQAVQELKNRPGMWHKAKRVQLQSGQSEVRVDFPLPIVACNLMMEYADFYENQQATGESLQCPRCSQSVPANPGVCSNCGENVFQCHKCRAINYDEKDPFLCHACGFCKYAKFDYTLMARPCCAVDTIENDEERKKMVQTIGALLDKADRVYRQLVANKPVLESLLHKISEHRLEGRTGDENSNASSTAFSGAQINRVIQTLAHKYCVDSKGHFEDLSKIIQKVLACRKELVSYDRSQSEQLKGDTLPVYAGLLQNYDGDVTKECGGGCYGCSLACAEHCLTLLRALASQPDQRARLCRFGLVHELVHHNLHRGTPQCQEEVRSLICLVTRDNLPATEHLCNLLSQRITLSLMGHAASQDHNNSVRPLVVLLGSLVKVQDSVDCWEARLRCIVKLWVWCCPQLTEVAGIAPAANALLRPEALAGIPGINTSSPNSHQFALQQVALPCLRYMQELMVPATPAPGATTTDADQAKESKETTATSTTAPMSSAFTSSTGNVVVDLAAWLAGQVPHAEWRRLVPTRAEAPPADCAALPPRDLHLAHKYLAKWRERILLSHGMRPLSLEDGGWLRPVMFDPSSRMARDTACQMVKSLCDSYERTKAVLILLTSFLPEVGAAGEASEQFLQLYQSLASETPWKQFLALRGVLQLIADLMTKEIEQLHRLEETTLTSDLAQGYALKRLTELLAMFLEESGARRTYKGRLVGAVLGGYLSLRRLVVQRTRLTDDTQEKLLELLEEMTTGTETETAEFMAVCIETVQKYPLHDYRTPVFIFERLCSIIYPEENDVGEFFLTLEKDPQQEDFLQGRMLGNPYSSLEPGMGPLMRDVKNKICTDCELVALLEDDNGMELLVCNKIMSLDLPVKDVYKKVWCTSGEGVDAMRVVYRMRGLLGDATEEFVETLSQTNAEAVDDEQVYRMANVLADCGGLEVMLQRLAAIGRVGAARALCSTLLRLLALCARVRRCVRVLTRADTRALPVLLHALTLAAHDERDMPRAHLVYQLLEIMERILSVAASESLESFLQFSLTFGGPEYVQALLNCTECPGIRNNSVALGHLTRVLAALVYGNDLKMAMLVDHFKPVLDFDRLDSEQWTEEEFRMELFCVLCANIEKNSIGGTLKDYLISLGVVRDALEYIVKHAPCVKPTLVCTDSDELKEFISRPALKYILRFLTGLAADHEPTQMLVCEKVIPIVHRLEQVSSGEHVGSLAENLLEALRSQPQCAAKIQQVRDFTRQEKKRLAMAVRERQLGALGMRSNERGQVTAQCSLTQQLADLAEEAGAVCCICREGYKYQPTKVLGIYTYTKRCPVEEYEVRARKTLGYTTVSHYNIVHVECHMAAVRLARARDEWESAALQNASTRCNGLLPLWGPHVPESAFASCLARHTTYLQECTGHRDIGHTCTLHDLKLLLVRFARGRTFHDDTGGGGPLSNMQLVPALVHMALYVINTSRVAGREVTALEASLAWAPAKVLESAHEAEGPLYFITLMLVLYPHAKWRALKVEQLKRLLLMGHVRAAHPAGPAVRALAPEHRAVKQWADYKPYALFVAIIDQLYNVMFKTVSATTVDQWPLKLAEYIRHNDEANAKAAERIVTTLTDELLPCASFAEFCDAAGFLELIPDPDAFLQALIDEQP
ncbi:hypothetical protein O3G_MSEX013740 [Manduca sexta]|uniref:UBR-type domain-containing protein n=1 Tax=Manduca sexta TaxID=7130 RepID=A0A921ZST3_MANSE|nr:hypothetical protein O3G_MSEX013740 [Manduca sexta]KAG6463210.1 hypothetical protein O3G_MSEX013740 [Manduca sexta]KAG6463211.1 hypothetical protein O3G_MSEX013740 [Manduca sexta]KAG6463213.1 hypothetical protein O3G_MSEX013740 [Manduca sexta]